MTELKIDIERLKIFDEKYKNILKDTKNIRSIAKSYRRIKGRIEKINKQNIEIKDNFKKMLDTECSEINQFVEKYNKSNIFMTEHNEIQSILTDIQTSCFIINAILDSIEFEAEL